MLVKPFLGLLEQPSIKLFFTPHRLIAGHQQNGFAFGIKRKGYPPLPTSGLEAKFLHVGVFATLERVYGRTPCLWPILCHYLRTGKQAILNLSL